MSIVDNCIKIENISDALYLADYQVEEEDLIMNLVVGLPFEYNAIVAAITSRGKNDDLTLREVSPSRVVECRIEQNTAQHNLDIQANNCEVRPRYRYYIHFLQQHNCSSTFFYSWITMSHSFSKHKGYKCLHKSNRVYLQESCVQ